VRHLEVERELRAEAAAAEERARIARELHDIAAHDLFAIVVQAGAADPLVERGPAVAREVLLGIRAQGRRTLTALRGLVGVLRRAGRTRATPSDVPDLVAAAADTGMDVSLTVRGDDRALERGHRPGRVPAGAGGADRRPAARERRRGRGGGRLLPGGTGGGGAQRVRAARTRTAGRSRRGPHGRTGAAHRWGARRRTHLRRRLAGASPVPEDGGAVTIRVVVVDDQAVVRAGFRTILESESDVEVVGEAGDGADAVSMARRHPDVVRMPRVDGITATARLAGPGVVDPLAVPAVATFDLDEYVFAALRSGASGFVLKDLEPDELVAAVRVRVTAGDSLVAPGGTRRLIAEFARASPPRATGPLPDLTERERETWLLVARKLSNAEIAAGLVVSLSTVKTHVGNLLAELGCRDRVQAVVLAYERGIVRPGSS
jgi:DNA-binding NarL/FixJ family response regulator